MQEEKSSLLKILCGKAAEKKATDERAAND